MAHERIPETIVLAVVGPPPKYIGGYSRSSPTRLWIRNSLYDVLLDIQNDIKSRGDILRLSSPLSQGVCLEAAMVAVALNIPVDCYVVRGLDFQSKGWKKETRARWLEVINMILNAGGTVDTTSKTSADRNLLMIDNCDIGISVLNANSNTTGTTFCLTKEMEKVMPVTIISLDTQSVFYGVM